MSTAMIAFAPKADAADIRLFSACLLASFNFASYMELFVPSKSAIPAFRCSLVQHLPDIPAARCPPRSQEISAPACRRPPRHRRTIRRKRIYLQVVPHIPVVRPPDYRPLSPASPPQPQPRLATGGMYHDRLAVARRDAQSL